MARDVQGPSEPEGESAVLQEFVPSVGSDLPASKRNLPVESSTMGRAIASVRVLLDEP